MVANAGYSVGVFELGAWKYYKRHESGVDGFEGRPALRRWTWDGKWFSRALQSRITTIV